MKKAINLLSSFFFLRPISKKSISSIVTSLILFLIISLSIGVTPVKAAITQITNDNITNAVPRMKDGKIVWYSCCGNTNEIFLYDIATGVTTQITNNNYNDDFPSIDNGYIVWRGNNHLFLYNIASATTTQITNQNIDSDTAFQINTGKVVWASSDGNDPEIYFYDIASGITTQITNNDYTDYAPQVNAGKIVWGYIDNSGNNGISLYASETGMATQISDNNYYNSYPQIGYGKAAWTGYDINNPNNTLLFIYDLTTETTTQTDITNYGSGIGLGDGKVILHGDDSSTNLFLFDIATGTITQITNTATGGGASSIDNGRVVYQGSDGTSQGIYLYDITTGTATRIQGSDGGGNPVLNDGKVLWDFYDGHDGELNLWDGVDPTPTPTQTPTPTPVTVTFDAVGDTYVRSGQDNHNYGAGNFMNIQNSGNNRSIVKFDQGDLQSTIGSGTVLSAKVQLTITDNGNNWGSTGRTVDLHRMIAAWDEGNGTENDRGTGSGNTWNCASDSNIANQAKNCSGNTEWEMGQPNNPNVHPWNATATDTKTITNNQSGVVEYDVTSDVAAFMNGTNNYGWLLKKTNEGQNGQVSFGTRESASVPQLVVTYQP